MNTRWILIVMIGFLCLIAVLMTWSVKAMLEREYYRMVDKWNRGIVVLKVIPTPENVFGLQREYKWMVDKDKEIKEVLSKRRLPDINLTPLQFKEELLNSQTKLKQLADIQGSRIQDDLGFPEYIAGEIPDVDDVPLLGKQLTVINGLVNIFLKHKVSEIVSIQRSLGIYQAKGDLYKEMVFKIELQCALEDLLGILTDIMNTPYILVVDRLGIRKIDEAKVNVEMLVGAVEFG